MQTTKAKPLTESRLGINYGYRHVLMAVDNSAHSDKGIEIGLAIAKAFGAEATGSHAYAARLHDLRFKQMEGGLPEQYRKEEELEKQRDVHDSLISHGLEVISDSFLDVVEDKASKLGIELKRKSVEGKNYRALLDDIESSDYDLVVIGALGLGAVSSSTIGSVCERVVRRTNKDILVIKNTKRSIGDGPIVVALDGSSQGYAGLKTALLLGNHFGVSVEVISAFDPYFHYVAFNSIANVLSEEAGEVFKFEEQEKLHEEIIDSGLAKIYQAHLAVSEKIAKEDDAHITTKLLSGKAYEVILKYIKKRNPSLLIMGKTGVHSDAGMDIGNNTENLLRLAGCHLLITNRIFDPSPDMIAEETTSWTEEAEERMGSVPDHVRKMARMAVIRYAQDNGHTVISSRIVDETIETLLPAGAMKAMGMISKVAEKRQQRRDANSRIIVWDKEAKEELLSIEEESIRENIKLRADKLAYGEKQNRVTADMVRSVMGKEESDTASSKDAPLTWSDDAKKRLERVPAGFMRDASIKRVEGYARDKGCSEITLELCEAGLSGAMQSMMSSMKSGGGMGSMMSMMGGAMKSGGMGSMMSMMGMGKDKPQTKKKLEKPEWSDEAKSRMESVPEGFMRTLTCQRIEEFASHKGVACIDNDLIDAKYAEWGEGSAQQKMEMKWEEDALARVERIPDFVRGMVIKEVERTAKERGLDVVDVESIGKMSDALEKGNDFHSEPSTGK